MSFFLRLTQLLYTFWKCEQWEYYLFYTFGVRKRQFFFLHIISPSSSFSFFSCILTAIFFLIVGRDCLSTGSSSVLSLSPHQLLVLSLEERSCTVWPEFNEILRFAFVTVYKLDKWWSNVQWFSASQTQYHFIKEMSQSCSAHTLCAKEEEKRHRMRCDCSFIWTLPAKFSTISYAHSLAHSLSCAQKRHSSWQIFLSTVNEIIWSKSEILLLILLLSCRIVFP